MEKGKIAVAYLAHHEDERPENTIVAFEKLMASESDASKVGERIDSIEKELAELKPKLSFIIGSIESAADIISGMLNEDDIEEWSKKYNEEQK